MKLSEKVFRLTKKVPKGKVTTYLEIAKRIDSSPRAIGQTLKKNRDKNIPCHRVIKSDGSLGGFKGRSKNPEKKKLVLKEGIKIENNKVDLEKYFFKYKQI